MARVCARCGAGRGSAAPAATPSSAAPTVRRSVAGRPRSASHRDRRGSRNRRAAAPDGSRTAPGGSADRRDAPVRPATCLRGWPLVPRKYPGSGAVRSITLQFQARSRLRCCTGDSVASTMATSTCCSSIAWPRAHLAGPQKCRGLPGAQRQDGLVHDHEADRRRQTNGFLSRASAARAGSARVRPLPSRSLAVPRQDNGGAEWDPRRSPSMISGLAPVCLQWANLPPRRSFPARVRMPRHHPQLSKHRTAGLGIPA